MSGVGDGFAWPFQDPDWLSKLVVRGLIALIPSAQSRPVIPPGSSAQP